METFLPFLPIEGEQVDSYWPLSTGKPSVSPVETTALLIPEEDLYKIAIPLGYEQKRQME